MWYDKVKNYQLLKISHGLKKLMQWLKSKLKYEFLDMLCSTKNDLFGTRKLFLPDGASYRTWYTTDKIKIDGFKSK